MATTKHMIRKMEQAGFEVERYERGMHARDGVKLSDQIIGRRDGWEISFWDYADGQGSAPYSKREGERDDIMTDYFAGSFSDNITRAIHLVDFMVESARKRAEAVS